MISLVESAGILRLPSVDSTNSESLRQWRAGQRKALWIVAGEQTAGRGRENRNWVSGPGNLYTSLLLPLNVPQRVVPQISLVAALAVHEVACQFCPNGKAILKWPNDCLINGAKVAGILIEGISLQPLAVCIGVGINIAHAPRAVIYPTTCLSEWRKNDLEVNADTVFQSLRVGLSKWLSLWQGGQGTAGICEAWCARSFALSSPLQVRVAERMADGLFAGLGEDGELLLQTREGSIERIFAGEIVSAREFAA